MKKIDKGTRLLNYLVDLFIIYIFWAMVFTMIGSEYNSATIFYAVMFFYYFILELSFGQTIGKLVSKTKVVHKNGGKAGFMKILLRSFWRLIPIDAFSYLFGTEIGMHDALSSTRLTSVKKSKE